MAKLGARLKHAWNAFTDSDSARNRPVEVTAGSYFGGRPDRIRPTVFKRTIDHLLDLYSNRCRCSGSSYASYSHG